MDGETPCCRRKPNGPCREPEPRHSARKAPGRSPAAKTIENSSDMSRDPRLARLRLGQMLTGLAKKRGIIPKAIAYNCGISYSTASGILRGAVRPSNETLTKILDRLGASEADRELATSLLNESRTVRQFDVSSSNYEYIMANWQGDLEGWQRGRDEIWGRR